MDFPPLAVSLGDPAGVGPELIAAAWARREAEELPPFFVAGGAEVLQAAAQSRGIALPVAEIFHPAEALDLFGHVLPVLAGADGNYAPGTPDRAGAELALASGRARVVLEAAMERLAIEEGLPLPKGWA